MKFASYRRNVGIDMQNPTSIGATMPGRLPQANTEGYSNLVSDIGQANKVLLKMQDEADARDVMKARNEIMTELTSAFYGKDGMITNGIGENAEGLTDRVTETIDKTAAKIGSQYNGRVQRALAGTVSENMANFQRTAASQEGREYLAAREKDYTGNMDNIATLVSIDPSENNLSLQLAEGRKLTMTNANLNGLGGEATQAYLRTEDTKILSTAVKSCLNSEDYDRAAEILQNHRKDMDQDTWNQQWAQVKKNQKTKEYYKTREDFFTQCTQADGTFDYAAYEKLVNDKYGPSAVKTVEVENVVYDASDGAAAAYNAFKKAGYSDDVIAGFLGRMQQEHNFQTSNVEEYDAADGNHYGGYGMFQWNGDRTTRFLQWTQENGLDPQDAAVQVQHAITELSERGMTPEAMNGMTTADAATMFTDKFEVGKHGYEQSYASEWRDRIQKGEMGSGEGRIVKSTKTQSAYEPEVQQRLLSDGRAHQQQLIAEKKRQEAEAVRALQNRIAGAPDYLTALDYARGSRMEPEIEKELEQYAANIFHISTGRTSSGGRSGSGGAATATQIRNSVKKLGLFANDLHAQNKITAKSMKQAEDELDAILENGGFTDLQLAVYHSIVWPANNWSGSNDNGITATAQNYGIYEVYESAKEAALAASDEVTEEDAELVAAAVVACVDTRYAPDKFTPESENSDEEEE